MPFDVWVPVRNLRLKAFVYPPHNVMEYMQRPIAKWWGCRQRLRFQNFRIRVKEGIWEPGAVASDDLALLPKKIQKWFKDNGYVYVSLEVGKVQAIDGELWDFGDNPQTTKQDTALKHMDVFGITVTSR